MPGPPSAPSIRRLSPTELAHTYEALVGNVPEAMGQLPSGRLTYAFERVAESQTVSTLHVEALERIAQQAAADLLGGGLSERFEGCTADILPPATPRTLAALAPSALVKEPGWSLCTAAQPGDCDDAFFFLYAPEPWVSAPLTVTAAGPYRITLDVDHEGSANLELRVNDVVQDQWTLQGGQESFQAEVTLEEGTHNVQFAFSGVGGARLWVRGFSTDGPMDAGEVVHAEARQACARTALPALAERAFRRPLSDAERQRALAPFESVAPEDGFAAGMLAALEAILRSPYFLYHVELAEGGNLSAWELANRLSYFACESPPDEALQAAARSGALTSPDELRAQAARLLDSPCGHRTVAHFYSQWLELDRVRELAKDPELFPEFNPELRESMARETERFVEAMTWEQDALLADMYTAQHSYLDRRSAPLYGLSSDADLPEHTALPESRAGLLTQPSFLALHAKFDETSPVLRGAHLLARHLCRTPPPPPAELMVEPPAPDPTLSTRQRWAAHSNDPTCAGCHQQIDPVGFALEGFDALGRERQFDQGIEVDTSGGVPSIGVPAGTLEGGAELSVAVGTSEAVRECFARHWFRFALGRLERNTQPADEDTLAMLTEALASRPVADVMLSIVDSAAFGTKPISQEQP